MSDGKNAYNPMGAYSSSDNERHLGRGRWLLIDSHEHEQSAPWVHIAELEAKVAELEGLLNDPVRLRDFIETKISLEQALKEKDDER